MVSGSIVVLVPSAEGAMVRGSVVVLVPPAGGAMVRGSVVVLVPPPSMSIGKLASTDLIRFSRVIQISIAWVNSLVPGESLAKRALV